MTLFALLLAALAVVVAIADWRWGLYAVLAVGFLQDPLRKLIAGQSVTFTVLVLAVFVGCVLGALRAGEMRRFGELFRWFPRLRAPTVLFVLIVLVQSGVTLVRTRSFALAGLGVLAYLSPIAAIVVGQRAFASTGASLRFLRLYLAGAVLIALSVVAQFLGYRNPTLRSIGHETVYGIGGRIEMMCGLMRSSEIAAWHLGIGASLALCFSIATRNVRLQSALLAATLLQLVAVVLTGRRKMLVEFTLFLVCYSLLLLRRRGGASRLVVYLTVAGVSVLVGGSFLVATGRLEEMVPYLDRSLSVVGESGVRLHAMTIGAMGSVISTNGFFGSGAGTGAQGSQYFGGGIQWVGGGAEGGAAKVLAELGVPGALAALWLVISVGAALLQTLRLGRRARPETAQLFYGLGALFPANAAVFITAHQVFGDPFVVLLLGLFLGVTFALPRHLFLESRATATEQTPPPARSSRIRRLAPPSLAAG